MKDFQKDFQRPCDARSNMIYAAGRAGERKRRRLALGEHPRSRCWIQDANGIRGIQVQVIGVLPGRRRRGLGRKRGYDRPGGGGLRVDSLRFPGVWRGVWGLVGVEPAELGKWAQKNPRELAGGSSLLLLFGEFADQVHPLFGKGTASHEFIDCGATHCRSGFWIVEHFGVNAGRHFPTGSEVVLKRFSTFGAPTLPIAEGGSQVASECFIHVPPVETALVIGICIQMSDESRQQRVEHLNGFGGHVKEQGGQTELLGHPYPMERKTPAGGIRWGLVECTDKDEVHYYPDAIGDKGEQRNPQPRPTLVRLCWRCLRVLGEDLGAGDFVAIVEVARTSEVGRRRQAQPYRLFPWEVEVRLGARVAICPPGFAFGHGLLGGGLGFVGRLRHLVAQRVDLLVLGARGEKRDLVLLDKGANTAGASKLLMVRDHEFTDEFHGGIDLGLVHLRQVGIGGGFAAVVGFGRCHALLVASSDRVPRHATLTGQTHKSEGRTNQNLRKNRTKVAQ